jgi:hypothetical protein
MLEQMAMSESRSELFRQDMLEQMAMRESRSELFRQDTTKSLRKLEATTKGLTAYNAKRDSNFELVICNRFIQELKDQGWTTSQIYERTFYDERGRIEVEWDGIVLAKRHDLNVLFIMETKQVFKISDYRTYLKRFDKMEKKILPKILEGFPSANSGEAKDKNTSKASQVFEKHLAPLNGAFIVRGCISSYSFDMDVLDEVDKFNVTSVVISSTKSFSATIRLGGLA